MHINSMAPPPTRDWHTVLWKLMNKINSNLLLFLKVPGEIVFVCTQLSHMKYDCHLCCYLSSFLFAILHLCIHCVSDYNFSHRIDHFSFGDPVTGVVYPLDGTLYVTDSSK